MSEKTNFEAPFDILNECTSQIGEVSYIMKSVNSPVRQQIISLLLEKQKSAVHELCNEMKLKQSIISQNLAILRRANLVTSKREGRQSFYSMNEAYLEQVMGLIRDVTAKVGPNSSTKEEIPHKGEAAPNF